MDWNDQKYCEIWRQGWADTATRYLEAVGCKEPLDLRSYARQGIDKIPTVHMVYALVLNKIRECAAAALMDDEAVADRLTDTCQNEQKDQREALERSLTKDEERIEVLEKMVLRLYEDMVAERITDVNFNLLLSKTQKEQAELRAKVEDGRKRLADEIRLAVDACQ